MQHDVHRHWPQGALPVYGSLVMEGFVLLFMLPAALGSLLDVVRARMAAGEEGTGCSEGEVKRMGRKLLQGLDGMERLGYVHRDIKVRRVYACLPAFPTAEAGRHGFTRRALMSR